MAEGGLNNEKNVSEQKKILGELLQRPLKKGETW